MIFLILGAVQICLQHDIDIPRRIRNLLEFSGTKSSKTSVHLDSFLLHLKNYFDFCIERFFYVCNYHHVYLFIFCKKIKYIISINIVDEMTSFFSLCNGPNLGNRLYISLYFRGSVEEIPLRYGINVSCVSSCRFYILRS